MIATPVFMLRRAASLALASLVLCGSAWAQNATNGEVVYGKTIVSGVRSCLSCHGTPREDPVMSRGANAATIKAAVRSQARMQPLDGSITDAEFNDLAAYIGRTLSITPTYIAIASAPAVSLSATTLSFASQNVGTTSTAQTVTVRNAANATAALAISSIAATAGSDFTVSGGSCSTSTPVAAGGSCTVNVAFRPTAAGTRNGSLTVAHNGAGGRSEVSLSGNGVATTPAVTVSPASLSFSSVVGTAASPLRATLSNTGSGNLVLSMVGFGGSHASDFALARSSTCAANASIAGGSSCVMDIVFTPGATGTRSATLTVAHNAAGGPTAISLSGTGTTQAQPGIALDATTLDLGNQVVEVQSTAKTLTLTNSGAAALSLGSLTLTGADASTFVLGGTCRSGGSVAAKGTCTLTVAMKPLTLGTQTATLNIASNAPTGPVTVALRGVSVRTPAPEVGLSQAALDFGTVTFGVNSIARSVTLSNNGTAAMTVTSIASTSSEFTVSHNCPASLAVDASCVIRVTFKPVSANAAESVLITTNAVSSPNSVVLTGLGTRVTMPVLAWQPATSALTFASTVVGVTSASQSLTLVNQGPGAALISSLGAAGADPSSFAIGSASTCKAGLSLEVNERCTVMVSFVPGSTGAKSANLQVASNATPPGDVMLSGSGASPSTGNGSIAVSPGMLDFSSVGVVAGQTSSSLTVGVSNGSARAVTVSKIDVSGPFSIVSATSNNCATSNLTLLPGGACNVGVVFSPSSAGAGTGTLTLTTTTGQTVEVGLRGQANGATATLAWQRSNTSVAFSSTVVGQTSGTQTLTLTNPGAIAATVSSVSLSGTDAASFAIASGSTCRANTSLAAGATCSVVLGFNPTSAGSKSATLKVGSSATPPNDVMLSGVGMAANPSNGMLTVNESMLDFSSAGVDIGQTSAARSLTVSNGPVSAVTLSKVEVSGPFKVTANSCPVASSAIAVNTSCAVAVVFAPTSSGNATGSLTLTTASKQVLVVALEGQTSTPAPVLTWQAGSATALQFASTEVGFTSAAKSLTLSNRGPGAVSFTTLDVVGSDAAQFAVAPASTCRVGSSLAEGASCQLSVQFSPSSAGNKSASLRVASNAAAPATVILSGAATSASAGEGMLWVDFSSLGFVAAMGRESDAQTVVVKNLGTRAFSLLSIGTTGPFQVVNSPSDACSVPQELLAGESCNLTVVFTAPREVGDSTGSLLVESTDNESQSVDLSGRATVSNGGSNANEGEGGGALEAWPLVLLALAVAALAWRRPESTHPSITEGKQ